WEWCADWYRPDEYARRVGQEVVSNPTGPAKSFDPREPQVPKRVTRGGSFLCHVRYCESYRPAARRGTAADTGMSHIRVRCVRSASAKYWHHAGRLRRPQITTRFLTTRRTTDVQGEDPGRPRRAAGRRAGRLPGSHRPSRRDVPRASGGASGVREGCRLLLRW